MKPKNHKSHKAPTIDDEDAGVLPIGMQKTTEVNADEVEKDEDDDTFPPIETGRVSDSEGSGNRQDNEAAELEEIQPDLEERMRS